MRKPDSAASADDARPGRNPLCRQPGTEPRLADPPAPVPAFAAVGVDDHRLTDGGRHADRRQHVVGCAAVDTQRDNLRVGRHDGVVAVIEKLKGHPLFAHVTLVRSERSPIAALVTEMLEDNGL